LGVGFADGDALVIPKDLPALLTENLDQRGETVTILAGITEKNVVHEGDSISVEKLAQSIPDFAPCLSACRLTGEGGMAKIDAPCRHEPAARSYCAFLSFYSHSRLSLSTGIIAPVFTNHRLKGQHGLSSKQTYFDYRHD
jgi:hypothetical protein